MSFRSIPRRAAIYIVLWFITRVGYLDHRWYMRLYIPFLKRLGYNLTGTPRYISNRTRIDGTDPSLITIGDDVVISSNVRVLTHDFSVTLVDKARGITQQDSSGKRIDRKKVAGVSIGDNSFVGAFAILMPGSTIGKDCIIGAGSVIRGNIPDGSIVIGNPGQVIRSVYLDTSATAT
jgi:acetyltransferase-like isoleucine patch superfamily enzyme